MSGLNKNSGDKTPPLKSIVDEIVEFCDPWKIYLFSEKKSPAGDLSSAKLCVVLEDGNSAQIEEELYINLDIELPCDFLVYTREEFEKLLEQKLSFASKICGSGRLLYEKD